MSEAMRELERDGILWTVREADGSLVPGTRGPRCLIFDGESIVRRLWSYPDSWVALDDDALWQLLGPRVRGAPQPSTGARSVTTSDQTPAAAIRQQGMPPEQALVRIKGAVAKGIGTAIPKEDADVATVVGDAVAWGIAAYYAA